MIILNQILPDLCNGVYKTSTKVSAFVETVNLITFNLKYAYLTFFLVVVNMILINMMMAIINMAFEEIKEQKDTYQNKFEIIEYIKRSVREITGVRLGFINFRSYFVFVGPATKNGRGEAAIFCGFLRGVAILYRERGVWEAYGL